MMSSHDDDDNDDAANARAIDALLSSAEDRKNSKEVAYQQSSYNNGSKRREGRWGNSNKQQNTNHRPGERRHDNDDDRNGYYGPSNNNNNNRKRTRDVTDDERPARSTDRWERGESVPDDDEEKPKEKADFGLSGALGEDEKTGNVYKGVKLKFREPADARAPRTRWRLYVFKKNSENPDPMNVLHVSKQSAYLFGRDQRIADVFVEHPSLSKQHCVLQYRAVPDKASEGEIRCKPYLMDLGSTNGTFVNGERLESARYYELRRKDVVTLGQSSREYVFLSEHTS